MVATHSHLAPHRPHLGDRQEKHHHCNHRHYTTGGTYPRAPLIVLPVPLQARYQQHIHQHAQCGGPKPDRPQSQSPRPWGSRADRPSLHHGTRHQQQLRSPFPGGNGYSCCPACHQSHSRCICYLTEVDDDG
jgi:hypothetical protein